MKIKNKLLLSYLSVIIAILAVAVFASMYGMGALERRTITVAKDGVEDIVRQNFKLSQNIMTKVGERFVVMKSDSAALELKIALDENSSVLKHPDGTFDYTAMRKSFEIRRIVAQPVYTMGERVKAGYLDLLDRRGVAVIHPNPHVEGKNFSMWQNEYPEMWKLVKESFTKDNVTGYYSFLNNENKPVKKFMALKHVKGTPFIVCVVVEIDKYFVPVHKKIRHSGEVVKHTTDIEINEASDQISADMQKWGVLIAFLLLLVGILLAVVQAASTSRPMRNLAAKVREIGKGDFSVKVPEKGSLEIQELASSFNALGQELTDYIETLKKETAAREAMESEIKVTREIQQSLLPHKFPPFPDKTEFELFAALVPAKEVSGDFYDFFFVDEERTKLALIIADVSGKGLPAAIFMAVSRTLLRNLCLNLHDESPEAILTRANKILCMENDAAMFVTTFLGYYDINTGEMQYANAGHNPFISLKKDKKLATDGILCDFPMGIIEDHKFTGGSYTVTTGESIVFYTDGVTDATSEDKEFYGTERFYGVLEQNKDKSPEEVTEAVKADVMEFQGEHQFDDITLMVLQRRASTV